MKMTKPITLLACIASLISTLVQAEETAVVKDNHVNVRGQPSLAGEVVTQLQKGEKVVLLDEVAVVKPRTNEPPRWAKIQMPKSTPVWVYAPFLTSNKTVRVTRLNLRAGPGENFSVLGRLDHGTSVTEIRRREDWMEIETPPGAYGFVAADLLTKEAGEPAVAGVSATPTAAVPSLPPPPLSSATPSVAPAQNPTHPPLPGQGEAARNPTVSASPPSTVEVQPVTQAVAPPSTAAPTEHPEASDAAKSSPPPTSTEPSVSVVPPSTTTEKQTAVLAPAPPDLSGPTLIKKPAGPLVRRIVRREGIVRSTTSIQAPTYFELLNVENHKTINYLHLTKPDVNLEDYRGRRVVVTGEEELDARWPNTPVLEVQTLELVP